MKKLTFSLALLTTLAVVFSPSSHSRMEASTYKLDSTHSSIHFKIAHLGVSHTWGRFNKMSGSLKFQDSGEGSMIEITADTTSVDTNSTARDLHLKNADFFSAGEFPTITFKSTAWKKTGENTFDVTGDMTLHGKTNSVTAKVVKIGEKDAGAKFGYRIGFDAELSIKRSDFGMNKMQKFVGDDVKLYIAVEGVRQ